MWLAGFARPGEILAGQSPDSEVWVPEDLFANKSLHCGGQLLAGRQAKENPASLFRFGQFGRRLDPPGIVGFGVEEDLSITVQLLILRRTLCIDKETDA